MKVGTMLPAAQSVALNAQMAAAAAEMKIDSLWLPDHLLGFWHPELWHEFPAAAAMPDPDAFLDPFCVAAALGAETPLPLGTSVTDGCRRRGIDLVRAAMTLNETCQGGFTLGVGAGETESTVPFGYDFSRPVGTLERTLVDIRALLDTGRMPDGGPGRTGLDRAGPNGVPQIWVAAQGGPRSLSLAGRYGDGWFALSVSAERYAELFTAVRAAAQDAGRAAPIGAMIPVTMLGESRDQVLAALEATPLIKLLLLFAPQELWHQYGIDHPNGSEQGGFATIPHAIDPATLREIAPRLPIEMFEEWVMLGSAEEVATRLKPYADAGLEHVVLADMSALAYAPEDAMTGFAQFAELTQILHGLGS